MAGAVHLLDLEDSASVTTTLTTVPMSANTAASTTIPTIKSTTTSGQAINQAWWNASWASNASFCFCIICTICVISLLWAWGSGHIDKCGNWIAWYNHDVRYIRRRQRQQAVAQRRRRFARATPPQRRALRTPNNTFVFDIKFKFRSWRARTPRLALPKFRRQIQNTVEEDGSAGVPLGLRVNTFNLQSMTLMNERNLVGRNEKADNNPLGARRQVLDELSRAFTDERVLVERDDAVTAGNSLSARCLKPDEPPRAFTSERELMMRDEIVAERLARHGF